MGNILTRWMTNSVWKTTPLIGWFYGGNANLGFTEEVLEAVPAVTVALRPVDITLFAAGAINAACVGAQPVCSLAPSAFMATNTAAAPNRPVSYQSICLVSHLSFSLCAFSFCVPNSSPITHVLKAETNVLQKLQDRALRYWRTFRRSLRFPLVNYTKTTLSATGLNGATS